MSEQKSGRWETGQYGWDIIDENDTMVAQVIVFGSDWRKRADLVAACPELLAKLERLTLILEHSSLLPTLFGYECKEVEAARELVNRLKGNES